jgi:hydrogenase maturation factor
MSNVWKPRDITDKKQFVIGGPSNGTIYVSGVTKDISIPYQVSAGGTNKTIIEVVVQGVTGTVNLAYAASIGGQSWLVHTGGGGFKSAIANGTIYMVLSNSSYPNHTLSLGKLTCNAAAGTANIVSVKVLQEE